MYQVLMLTSSLDAQGLGTASVKWDETRDMQPTFLLHIAISDPKPKPKPNSKLRFCGKLG
jgi:hypothetical protein